MSIEKAATQVLQKNILFKKKWKYFVLVRGATVLFRKMQEVFQHICAFPETVTKALNALAEF